MVDAVSEWPADVLDEVVDDLQQVRRRLDRARKDGLDPWSIAGRLEDSIKVSDIGQLLGLSSDELERFLSGPAAESEAIADAAVNRVFARGAALHLDVVLLVPPETQPSRSKGDENEPETIRALDGRVLGVESTHDVHRAFGEQLVGRLDPSAFSLNLESLWFRATAAELLVRRRYGRAVPLLERALDRLSDDPQLLFYKGVLHEVFASPRVQSVRQSILVEGRRSGVDSPRRELELARRFLKESLEIDPDLLEARVRYARVLGLLGRPADARGELERTLPAIVEPNLQYYAELFLGDQQRALGDPEAARAAYARASRLYPRAQTPRLALSQLDRLSGGRVDAVEAMLQIIQRPRERDLGNDPWWFYELAHVLDAGALLDELRRALVSGEIR
jgi:tetratricopeptide (TPR) repeat protein